MPEYEVLIETVNPCGGQQHAKREFIEVETGDPEAWVRARALYPVMDTSRSGDGDTVVTTGDGKGSFVKYIFTE